MRAARVEQVRRTSGPKRSTHADTAEEIGPNFCEHPYRLDISTYADHARGVERWLCGGCKSVGESPWPPA